MIIFMDKTIIKAVKVNCFLTRKQVKVIDYPRQLKLSIIFIKQKMPILTKKKSFFQMKLILILAGM